MQSELIYLDKTDEELTKLTLKDREIYKYLMQRYEGKLLRYIIRLSGAAREDAEDILQISFLKAYQSLNNFDQSLKFSSWIYRIVHNETVTYLRKNQSRPKVLDSETSSFFLDLIKTNFDIQENIDKKKLGERVKEIIGKIDKKYRDVLILKYMEDKDYREISDILKKPPGTVATLLNRAKDRLKEEILSLSQAKKYYFGTDIK